MNRIRIGIGCALAVGLLWALTLTTVTAQTTPSLSGSQLAEALTSSGLPSQDVVIYTEETDKNHLLGRPGQYVAKINWTDPRYPDQIEGATIEAFANAAEMNRRAEYL